MFVTRMAGRPYDGPPFTGKTRLQSTCANMAVTKSLPMYRSIFSAPALLILLGACHVQCGAKRFLDTIKYSDFATDLCCHLTQAPQTKC